MSKVIMSELRLLIKSTKELSKRFTQLQVKKKGGSITNEEMAELDRILNYDFGEMTKKLVSKTLQLRADKDSL